MLLPFSSRRSEGKSGPTSKKFRPRVEWLEDRTAPAVYAVTLLSPAVGEPGETAAAHAGELRVNPALTARDGEQVIGAATPADAIRSALTGTVSISVGGQSASYPFGRDTAATSAADHQPYFVEVSGTEARVWLEDMAGLPDSDWDYNDRSWQVSIRQLSSGSFSGGSFSGAGGGMMSPLSPTIDSGQFTWTNLFGETATADYEVTEYAPDIWLWQYTVTNNNLSTSSPPPRHGVADIDIPAAAGAEVFDVQITGDVSNWHAEPNYPYWYRDSVAGSYLAPGQTAVLTFKTPPVPILPVTATAFVGARLPSHAEGPAKGPGKPPTVAATFDTTLIPVNANNDNWNPNGTAPQWRSGDQKFIPATRDFDATNLWQDDPQLVTMTVTIGGGYAGSLVVTSDAPFGGEVSFWKDNKRKQTAFQSQQIAAGTDPVPVTLYVEGTHESATLDDIYVLVEFIPQDTPQARVLQDYALTVAPVINSFTRSIPDSSVNFERRLPFPNGLEGLRAYDFTAEKPGIAFDANLTNGPLSIRFLQNLLNVQNGTNGSGAGAVYVAGSGLANKNHLPKPASGFTFPGLDATDAADPTADPQFTATPIAPDKVAVRTHDSPSTGTPADPDKLDKLDDKFSFRNYLVVKYTDGSLYVIAYWDWDVNFYATDNLLNFGVSDIAAASKVSAATSWERSNGEPLKTVGPIANGSFEWR